MEPIAIVGMACRFPGARTLSAFWELLRTGEHGIVPVPRDRWNVESLYDTDAKAPGKVNSLYGGFIDDIDRFDAAFFGISPREAVQMDPQQRVLLELTHEALEDAGLPPAQLAGSNTGVFVGLMGNEYMQHQTADNFRRIDVHTGSGAGFCMTANRISYQFDFRGPSMAVDSACSSSLVTTFMACQSLWSEQCELALAAGVNIMLSPAFNIFYAKAGLAAPDGRCKTFSAQADGIGRGEGAGMVVLKRLRDARRDKDNIYAVIRGGAVNHDGRSNGVTAPNRWAQEELLRTAYRHAGVSPADVQYVELHGTGTLIGDPIEANALGAVLTQDRPQDQVCLVGSVKTNVGHLEGAAGVAGLIKLALSIAHREIPPSLWFADPNPHIPFHDLPLKVQTALAPWPRGASRPLAGISSFGLGGTNAHLILEGAPNDPVDTSSCGAQAAEWHLFALSAHSAQALRDASRRHAEFLSTVPEERMAAICHAAALRRGRFQYRACIVGRNRRDLVAKLNAYASGAVAPGVYLGQYRQSPRPKLVFAYPHAGSLDVARVRALARRSSHFRDALTQCYADLHELAPTLGSLPESLERIDTIRSDGTLFAPTHVAVQIAMSSFWTALGLSAEAVVAAGLGQVAAYHAAGMITRKEALATALDFPHTKAPVVGDSGARAFSLSCHTPQGRNVPWDEVMLAPSGCEETPTLGQLAALHGELRADVALLHPGFAVPDRADWLIGFSARDEDIVWSVVAAMAARRDVAFESLFDFEPPEFVRLPTYAWQRRRFWLEAPRTQTPSRAAGAHAAGGVEEGVPSRAPSDPERGREREYLSAVPAEQRHAAAVAYLARHAAQALRMPVEQLDVSCPLNALGMDSLTALEVKNRVERDLLVSVPVVKFLDGYSVEDFAVHVLAELAAGTRIEPSTEPVTDRRAIAARTEPEVDAALLAQVETMSAEQVDRMLQELGTNSLEAWE